MREHPPGEPHYWDTPDPRFPAHLDTFSVFLMNEVFLAEMEDLDWTPQYVQEIRAVMDKAYVCQRQGLKEMYLSLPEWTRSDLWHLRDLLPEILYWPEGSVLDSDHPR